MFPQNDRQFADDNVGPDLPIGVERSLGSPFVSQPQLVALDRNLRGEIVSESRPLRSSPDVQEPAVTGTTYVTQPYLPPLEEFLPYLKQIWDSKILTNGGPFHCQLENALCEYLGVKHAGQHREVEARDAGRRRATTLQDEMIRTEMHRLAEQGAGRTE